MAVILTSIDLQPQIDYFRSNKQEFDRTRDKQTLYEALNRIQTGFVTLERALRSLSQVPPGGGGAGTRDWWAVLIDDASPLATGTDLSNHRPIDAYEGQKIRIMEWVAVLKVAPTTELEFQIQVSTNNGGSWTDLFTVPLRFAATEKVIYGNNQDNLDIFFLNRGDRLRYNSITVDGAAAVLTFILNGERVPA